MKRLTPLALLLLAPLPALAEPPGRMPGEPRMDGMQVEAARKGGAKLATTRCAFAPATADMKPMPGGALRVMLIDASGTLRYLGTLEESTKPASQDLRFSPDPVKGGT